jgi:transposase
MKGEITMVKYREIIRLHNSGVSVRNIAYSCGCARSTVQQVLNRAKMRGLEWPLPDSVDDREIYRILFPKERPALRKAEPDFKSVNESLLQKGVTLSLCWSEYCKKAIAAGEEPYQYSAFCQHYRNWAQANQVVLHIERRPAEQIMVDWAGATMETVDRTTGEISKVYIFVACLPYSSYPYAEGFYSMDQQSWLSAHVNAFEYFGGTTPILVPDNLKTGVIKTGLDELIINESYRRLAEYYGCAVVPARVRKPRDKAAVESSVAVITRSAIAPLRNRVFFTLSELNDALREKLDEISKSQFQKREGSRESVFLNQEKDALIPLPVRRFEVYTVKTATVPYNYHISADSIFYSVPFTYAKHKQEVEIRIAKSTVSVYLGSERIAMHKRSHGYRGSYVTNPDHMPDSHRDYVEWSKDRFRSWALEKGEAVRDVIDCVLNSKPIEQQTYRSCLAIINLAKKHGDEKLNEACIHALKINRSPSYKTVKTILSSMELTASIKEPNQNEFAYLRGASYFESESEK